jgi:hypothetical protein
MMEASRLPSVQTVQGFCVSMLPQILHISIFHRRLERGGERSHQQLAFFNEMQRRAPSRTGT